jgi:uncharacterized membrane protein YjdF
VLNRLRAHSSVLAVLAAFYVALIGLGAATDNGQTPYYAVLVPVLLLLVAYLDSRQPFTDLVLWGLALWAVMHMAGGLVPASGDRVLYSVWLLPFMRFDHLVHAIGFGFAGLAFREGVRRSLSNATSGAAIVWIGGLGIGALNEMIEFLITKVSSDTNIGGFDNTGWDLVANLVGASIAAFWVHRHYAVSGGEFE